MNGGAGAGDPRGREVAVSENERRMRVLLEELVRVWDYAESGSEDHREYNLDYRIVPEARRLLGLPEPTSPPETDEDEDEDEDNRE